MPGRISGGPLGTRGNAHTRPPTNNSSTQNTETVCTITRPTPGVLLEPHRPPGARRRPEPDKPGLEQEDAVLGREVRLSRPGCLHRVAGDPVLRCGVRLHVRCEPFLPPSLRGGLRPPGLHHLDRHLGLRSTHTSRWGAKSTRTTRGNRGTGKPAPARARRHERPAPPPDRDAPGRTPGTGEAI